MNRAERRNNKPKLTEREKIEKRLKAWVKTWNLEQKKLFEMMVSNEVNRIDEITELVLNECFGVIISESFPGTTIEEVNEILLKANRYIEEVKDYIEKEGENYMKKVNSEELRNNIKVEAKAMLKENPKVSVIKIIKALKENYDLPDKDLHILCQEARQELEVEKMKELENSIMGSAKIAAEGMEKLAEEKEGMILEAPGELKATLKIKSIEVEGKCGTYIKGSEGVKTGDKVYKDIKHIDDCIKNLDLQVEGHEKIINDQIQELKNQLEKLYKDKEEHLEKYLEIKAVFAIQ